LLENAGVRHSKIDPQMAGLGPGRVKTPAPAARVECLEEIAHDESQIMLRIHRSALENCIFYILSMYEFLHSLGQNRPKG
jgi:hypothetical protein